MEDEGLSTGFANLPCSPGAHRITIPNTEIKMQVPGFSSRIKSKNLVKIMPFGLALSCPPATRTQGLGLEQFLGNCDMRGLGTRVYMLLISEPKAGKV